MRNVPGRKRDIADCQWIAELHEHGLLRASFIPAAAVEALRARTRYRKRLIEQRTAEGQRLAKVLEDGIKIDSVASRLLGKSGREMIEALIAGERDPGRLADLARGCSAARPMTCRWPATAGPPIATARCAGCTWTPTITSPSRSPNWTRWSPRRPPRSRRSSPG
jgi:hypothetical protein